MRILGITGGIATGKSTVTQILSELGALTVSADAIARALLAPDTSMTRAVLGAFPACADANVPGKINRRVLAQIVFADTEARKRLESLTHPAIINALQVQIAGWRQSGAAPAAAAEIPLLFEAGLETLADQNIVVTCTEGTQIDRLCARDGISRMEAQRQIAAQWPLADKIARADTVVSTEGGLEETRRQVKALWESL